MLCLSASDVDLLGDLDSVIDLDAEVANRAFDLRMAEQKLDRPQISSSPIDQHRLRPPQRVRAELRRIEPDARHPFLHEPRVLPGRQSSAIAATCEQELTGLATRQPQVVVDGHPRLVGQLEPHGPAGLLLPDRRAVHRVAARRHVIDANGDDVTAAQLAVDRQVEQGEVRL